MKHETYSPIFTDSGVRLVDALAKIRKEIRLAEAHLKEAKEKDDEHIKHWEEKKQSYIKLKKIRNTKHAEKKINGYSHYQADREYAIDLIKQAAEFQEKFNELYSLVKEDILSDDHDRIEDAYNKIREIYPRELLAHHTKLKRMVHLKRDSQFFQNAVGWLRSIKARYETLAEGAKLIGKTDAQVQTSMKRSHAMRQRWGSF